MVGGGEGLVGGGESLVGVDEGLVGGGEDLVRKSNISSESCVLCSSFCFFALGF